MRSAKNSNDDHVPDPFGSPPVGHCCTLMGCNVYMVVFKRWICARHANTYAQESLIVAGCFCGLRLPSRPRVRWYTKYMLLWNIINTSLYVHAWHPCAPVPITYTHFFLCTWIWWENVVVPDCYLTYAPFIRHTWTCTWMYLFILIKCACRISTWNSSWALNN